MKKLMSMLLFFSALICTPAFAGTLDALDSVLNTAEKVLNTADKTSSTGSSEISYTEPQGFMTTIYGDDYYLTIYKDRIHTVAYVGDGEGALLFKITKKTPTSFSATCVADVSYDKWNKTHPKGTITGKLSGNTLEVTFSSPAMDVSDNGNKHITVTRVNEDISEFIRSKKSIFTRKLN